MALTPLDTLRRKGSEGRTHKGQSGSTGSPNARNKQAATAIERLDMLSKYVFVGTFVAIASVGFGIVSTLNAQEQLSAVSGDLRPVVVASSEIPAGSSLSASNLKIEQVPKSYVAEGGYSSLDEVTGKSACIRIPANGQVTSSQLSGESNGSTLAATITPGMQAVTVSVSADTGLSTLVRCGDAVNVELTDGNGAIMGRIADVTVLALDGSITNEKAGTSYNTVTLQVDLAQAEQILSTAQMGKVVLTMNPLSEG